ncbi:MAG: glyoxalase [Devosia sp.]|uniref:VOC family protein n=1 Tax=Devosia sp. TaxID=1871048 RepID=UPI0026091C23|nr:VOC family protein [Devosia sp.]MDB5585614.1 glyoxalase [Devosia sp.]
MNLTGSYPVLLVADVAPIAAFYQAHFGFKVVFASSWYVHLRATHTGTVELAIMDYDHDTIPLAGRQKTTGLLLSLEVADAAAEYARLAPSVTVLRALRDEPFGQRHFICADPNGVLLDVITPIEPDPEWLAAQS